MRLCHIVGERAKNKTAASVSLMGRFETEILTQSQNLKALMNQLGQWVDEVHKHKPIKEIILDMDSSDSPTFGRQEGSAYNGHFGYTCYHPLFVFNQFGDVERALLRNGNVYNSNDWKSVLEPIVERYRDENIIRYFRGDAAFANPNIYRFLEDEDYFYAIRLKGNIGNFLWRLALPKSINDWSLRTMREKLVKIEAKAVKHSRYVTFQMAEVIVPKSLFHEILEKIHRLEPVPIGSG